MSTDTTENRVREIVADQLGLNADDINTDAVFSSDLGADALDLVELIMSFEEEFDLEISDEDGETLRTVQDVVEYVGQRVQ